MNFILQLIILLTLTIASHAVEKFEPQLKLRQPFEDVLRGEKAIYGCSEGVTVSKIQNLMMNTPLSLGFGPALAAITNSVVEFSSEQAEKIAFECKKKYNNQFDQIGCGSIKVNEYFNNKTSINLDYVSINSPCRQHAHAFNLVFSRLKIKNSKSLTISISGKMKPYCKEVAHVVNQITLVTDAGQSYSYIIDSLQIPSEAFPYSKKTAEYHKVNSLFPNLNNQPNCDIKKATQDSLIQLKSYLEK